MFLKLLLFRASRREIRLIVEFSLKAANRPPVFTGVLVECLPEEDYLLSPVGHRLLLLAFFYFTNVPLFRRYRTSIT